MVGFAVIDQDGRRDNAWIALVNPRRNRADLG